MPQPIKTRNQTILTATEADRPCVHCSGGPATITTQLQTTICQQCASQYYHRCPGCRQWHRSRTSCLLCTSCDRCTATVPARDVVDTVHGSSICAQCRHDYYWQCVHCEGWNANGEDCGNCTIPDYDCVDEWDADGCQCEECSGYGDDLLAPI